jgi:catalase
VRERIVAMLRSVDETLALRVADGMGVELPQPRVLDSVAVPEVERSPALSLLAPPCSHRRFERETELPLR